MSSNRKNRSESEGPPSITDEAIRAYLLARLSEVERSELDRRLLVDDELAERVLLAESELADAYAAGELDRADRKLFEQKFLVTEARRRKVAVSAALLDHASHRFAATASAAVKPGGSWREAFLALFAFNRPAWSVAAVLVVLVLFGGVALFLARKAREQEPTIAKRWVDPSPTPVPDPSPSVSPGAAPSVSPEPVQKRSQPSPPDTNPPSVIATFILVPGGVRSGGELTRIAVPKGKRDVVRLQLAVETVEPGAYSAELLTGEGRALMIRDPLQPTNGGHLLVDIPSRTLRPGDYQIRLSRRTPDGPSEPVGRYYFRAIQN